MVKLTTIYVIDSSSLIDLFKHYYLGNFPTLWSHFDNLVSNGNLVSVKEVLNEVKDRNDRLAKWAKQNKNFFSKPSQTELSFVKQIFQVQHFHRIVKERERLKGKPVADPFVISAAKVIKACVVTEEAFKPNASKIPNVCKHFNIPVVNLQQFMINENWTF